MNTRSLFPRFCYSPIVRLATVMLVALGWSSLALCGEIHDAAKNGDLGRVKALVKDNPDLVFSTDNDGWTALHYAAFNGKKDVAELLLADHADVNAKDNKGLTPLHFAAGRDHRDVVELLLANNADVNAKANNGATPLDLAGGGGHKDVVELLRLHSGHE